MRACFRKDSSAAELCGGSAWALRNPLGRGCVLLQPLCLVFHREHPLWDPLAVVGRAPCLLFVLVNLIQSLTGNCFFINLHVSFLVFLMQSGNVQHLSFGSISPLLWTMCVISGSQWCERCAYTLCRINVSSSVLALISLTNWCFLFLCTSCTCCSFFLAIPGADKGRIRCLISLCSLRKTRLLHGTGGRATREESSPCFSVRFSALGAARAQADSKAWPKFSRHIFVPDACSRRKLKTQTVLPNLK